LAKRDPERDGDAIEAVEGDRLLAALDLANELAAERCPTPQSLLAEPALSAQVADTLAEEGADMGDRPFSAHALLGSSFRHDVGR
jgi:hypothetical protein